MITARSVRRVTEEEKWRMDDIEAVVGLPWDMNGERQGSAELEVEIPERAEPIHMPPAPVEREAQRE